MGVAMAGMVVPRLATLPRPAWAVVFAAGAAWFGWRALQMRRGCAGGPGSAGGAGVAERCCQYPVPHLVDCVTMLYMLWALPVLGAAAAGAAAGGAGGGGMAGMAAGARLPVIGLALALCICGYVVWLGDRIQSFAPVSANAAPAGGAAADGPAALGRSLLAPRAATCCKIAMGVAMGLMLVDML
jgi:hypothetical protein